MQTDRERVIEIARNIVRPLDKTIVSRIANALLDAEAKGVKDAFNYLTGQQFMKERIKELHAQKTMEVL
jgi:hypothetical protein